MNDITLTFLIIVLLFVFLLFLKKFVKIDYCVICASISLTWISLLFLYWYGMYSNLTMLAVLMGQSAVGFYYFVQKHIKENLLLFRLPFLLTETWIILFLLGGVTVFDKSFLLIVLSWFAIIILYIYRNNKKMNIIVKKIIACCKNW
ncbi:MAG: hypothetical protein A2725_04155 [Candidatus Magasanikbacteria bacterium RIFCSPHIGHO2_01_FULL_33_34]|uniref:Uncharacterized protein n=1 Tax=Candidatus Magasanikbacteria bacterium RIFCSPHIGHO2_01_FULL_33_34 TaxID=1798671 RepID=A0A1F6LHU3_9BACT|nr:MAG: hypothetical protein A2725_04155 [Candidatus Magasanikbacteria bacterium RIFCSPHIGHO2_01_FULL_33_34]OGH65159.1 MAG: hypothetical protein A3B83_03915 [Candidatus Magasanikbacteria bacterium RIFCSPHIGHO2_02_FULL_33_17]OGH75297.1 MAG: hypothetical protein A3A89_04250 [Candidatus Magasanikbacteria bacterium RIFCSPLOWO2_01_FULL_33_34]OGH81725.1 MAG: hypothetical protein A3F93_03190 [Candidatus Magasanikbacteria bacterium RIFCSPLOWO2_12_FULL_34_7]